MQKEHQDETMKDTRRYGCNTWLQWARTACEGKLEVIGWDCDQLAAEPGSSGTFEDRHISPVARKEQVSCEIDMLLVCGLHEGSNYCFHTIFKTCDSAPARGGNVVLEGSNEENGGELLRQAAKLTIGQDTDQEWTNPINTIEARTRVDRQAWMGVPHICRFDSTNVMALLIVGFASAPANCKTGREDARIPRPAPNGMMADLIQNMDSARIRSAQAARGIIRARRNKSARTIMCLPPQLLPTSCQAVSEYAFPLIRTEEDLAHHSV